LSLCPPGGSGGTDPIGRVSTAGADETQEVEVLAPALAALDRNKAFAKLLGINSFVPEEEHGDPILIDQHVPNPDNQARNILAIWKAPIRI
jgi:hypothetical protein